jgi:8-oxo-dGTP diphosphatase
MVQACLLKLFRSEAQRDGVQQFVVGAVVQHDGKVLLLQRPEDDFMGGILSCPAARSKRVSHWMRR